MKLDKKTQNPTAGVELNFTQLSHKILSQFPIGSICSFMYGYFDGPNNNTYHSLVTNTATGVNTLIYPRFCVCDGALLYRVNSPIYNGSGRYLPNLTDGRFLMGTTIPGDSVITNMGSASGSDTILDHIHDPQTLNGTVNATSTPITGIQSVSVYTQPVKFGGGTTKYWPSFGINYAVNDIVKINQSQTMNALLKVTGTTKMGIQNYSIAAHGSGYVMGDLIAIKDGTSFTDGGGVGAVVRVTGIIGISGVLSIAWVCRGHGYGTGSNRISKYLTGSGSGFKLNISSLTGTPGGTRSFSVNSYGYGYSVANGLTTTIVPPPSSTGNGLKVNINSLQSAHSHIANFSLGLSDSGAEHQNHTWSNSFGSIFSGNVPAGSDESGSPENFTEGGLYWDGGLPHIQTYDGLLSWYGDLSSYSDGTNHNVTADLATQSPAISNFTHSHPGGSPLTGTIGYNGAAATVNNIPKYLNCFYIQRVE